MQSCNFIFMHQNMLYIIHVKKECRLTLQAGTNWPSLISLSFKTCCLPSSSFTLNPCAVMGSKKVQILVLLLPEFLH